MLKFGYIKRLSTFLLISFNGFEGWMLSRVAESPLGVFATNKLHKTMGKSVLMGNIDIENQLRKRRIRFLRNILDILK